MKILKDFNFDDLQFFTKFYLIIYMIIGRVELLTLLIILKKYKLGTIKIVQN